MGGDVILHDKPGPGSRFTLTLPLATNAGATDEAAQQEPADQPAPAAAVPATSASTRHLLCVEADPATRILVATLAQRRPHWRVTTVADAAAGLAVVQAEPPDLVLLAANLAGAQWLALPGTVVLLGSEANNDVPHLAKPLDIPAFFALLDSHGKST